MLASLLATIEQGLGPSLASAGTAAFLIGIAILVYVALAPLIGIVVDIDLDRVADEKNTCEYEK